MHRRHVLRTMISRSAACMAVLTTMAAGAQGCLNRPIEPGDPRTTSTIVERLTQSRVDKIDLLLAIDNSGSMADKQQILADAVPDLVESLVNPRCLGEDGKPATAQPKGPLELCPTGTRREFPPVLDVHIGIITSSLGNYGGEVCAADAAKHTYNDKGRLIARSSALLQNDVPTYEGSGFLAWDPTQKLKPAGEKEIGDIAGSSGLIPTLRDMVKGVGQVGCAYEAQLESWYRFLVDPEPYSAVVVAGDRSRASEVDSVLLTQRAEFLRPDSLLAVLMLSDENDCSINEQGLAHLITRFKALPRMRKECAANTDDACCAPCGEERAECAPDPTCDEPVSVPDNTSLRCFNQKSRYGYDFLHPTDRYVKGLTEQLVSDRAGNLVPNPIFSDLNPTGKQRTIRDKSLVFFAGIVGVPWQDVARDPADLTKGFKDGGEMAKADASGHTAWDVILGDPAKGTSPLDPFMAESVDPREGGTNPVTGDAILKPGGELNGINGHERVTGGSDLQYACILPLPAPKSCEDDPSCDCYSPSAAYPNPLCKKDANGVDTSTQVSAKAYPGLRQLEVLKELGPQGIVASVCAEQVNDKAREDYGYRQAIRALVDQLKTALGGQCLSRPLVPENGQVSCLILEARKTEGECKCDMAEARQPVQTAHRPAVTEALEDENAEAAGWNCFCEIPQLSDGQLDDGPLSACQTDTSMAPTSGGEEVNGWCYVDATTSPPVGDPSLVESCDPTQRRMIRFVGKGEVKYDGTLFITCSGE